MHTPRKIYAYMQIFMFVGFVVIDLLLQPEEEAEEDEEHGNSVKILITCITPILQSFLDIFQISLAFNIFPILVLV